MCCKRRNISGNIFLMLLTATPRFSVILYLQTSAVNISCIFKYISLIFQTLWIVWCDFLYCIHSMNLMFVLFC